MPHVASTEEAMSEPRAHALYLSYLKSEQTMPEFADARGVSLDTIKHWFPKFREEGVMIVCPR